MNKNLIPAIIGKLGAEDVTKTNYTQELAEKKLSRCIAATKLIKTLNAYEREIIDGLEDGAK